MYRDPTTADRSNNRSRTITSQHSSVTAGKGGVENQKELLVPNTQANPEFAKWWKRWVSRAQRISLKRNLWARRIKIEPPGATRQAAPANPSDCEFKRYL